MLSARRRAAFVLVIPLVAAAGVVGLSSPAQAQSTLRGAAADDYLVGAAVSTGQLSNPTYANIAANEFSSITAENQMKWDTTEPSQGNFNFGPGDQIVNFANQNGQHVYGHTLVWHSQTPQWVQNLSGSAMSQAMQNHITQLMQRWPNIGRWDVVNEAFEGNGQLRNSFWLQGLGQGYIAQALQAARAADPDATLCLNDFSIDGINAKSTAYFNLIQQLQSQGVPIDCMGFQAHLILGQVPGDMQQNLQRFRNLGLEVWVTELDIRIPNPVTQQDLQQQAQDYARVFEICQNVGCAGVTTWGVHDAQSWVDSTFPEFDSPLLWDDNFNPKPAYNAVLDQLGGGGQQEDPPAAPTGLSATATSNSVSLSWNASSGATSYQVQRAPGASGGSFTQVGTTSGTSFTNTGLSPETTFRYRVTASNSAGTSSPSNTVTVTTQPGGTGGGDCEIDYTANNWGGSPGFTASVSITNNSSSTISGWTVAWSYSAGQTVNEPGWNATVDQTGSNVTAVNAPWNGTLAPNQSTSFGFNGMATSIGNNPDPTAFTLNGNACSVS